jgi:alpha-beta hydrolase superfamily lysophospholipase
MSIRRHHMKSTTLKRCVLPLCLGGALAIVAVRTTQHLARKLVHFTFDSDNPEIKHMVESSDSTAHGKSIIPPFSCPPEVRPLIEQHARELESSLHTWLGNRQNIEKVRVPSADGSYSLAGFIYPPIQPHSPKAVNLQTPIVDHMQAPIADSQTVCTSDQRHVADSLQTLRTSADEAKPSATIGNQNLPISSLPSTAAKPWVILVHGYRGEHTEMEPYALMYAQWGFNVLIPDLRAHGDSEGSTIGMGWTDSNDLRTWITYIKRRDPSARIVVHGHSMGAFATLCLARDTPSSVYALISDSAFTSVDAIFKAVLKHTLLPASLLTASADHYASEQGIEAFRTASALPALRQASVPILLFHGEQDRFIPSRMSVELYRACASSCKELHLVPGAGHVLSFFVDPHAYASTVHAFLERATSEEVSLKDATVHASPESTTNACTSLGSTAEVCNSLESTTNVCTSPENANVCTSSESTASVAYPHQMHDISSRSTL